MRKLCCIILCTIFTCAACAPQSAHTEVVTVTTQSAILEPTLSTHSQENAYQPDLSRGGYESDEPKIFSDSHLTKQDIITLGDALHTLEWESLANVLADFNIVLETACDIRMCDLTHFENDRYQINVPQPKFDEKNNIAYITVSSRYANDETEHVITFLQNQDNTFSPCSIITLSNDY